MAESVVILQDGDVGLGTRAVLVKEGYGRMLISFTDAFYERYAQGYITKKATDWFDMRGVSYCADGSYATTNTGPSNVVYINKATNKFYCVGYQTREFMKGIMDNYSPEYFYSLYGK
jgi:hypothetical protein